MFAKTFRNTLIASSLLIGASLLAGPAAMAQMVTATVAEDTNLVFVGATTPFTSGIAYPSYPMGNLDIRSNSALGFTLTVASTNGARLLGPNGQEIPYTGLTTEAMGGATVNVVNPTVAAQPLVTVALVDSVVAGGLEGVPVTADIAAGYFVGVGSYTDTLTFTLTANN